MFAANMRNKSRSATAKVAVAFAALLFLAVLGPALLNIDVSRAQECRQTARYARTACEYEALDDYNIALGNCKNLSDEAARDECEEDAQDSLTEANKLCGEQFTERLKVCELVGDGPYDPLSDSVEFVDPCKIGKTIKTNPYFPLVPGNMWVYKSTFEDDEGEEVTEIITVKVTKDIKLIEGVKCLVVTDLVEQLVEKRRVLKEYTQDWFAQDTDGNVWYFGESVRNFETFEGDRPERPELVDIDGSWKAGRDGAKPGILVYFSPVVDEGYRQEFALGDAEDVAQVKSITETESVPAASCNGNCLKTLEYTPLEPGIYEYKYYKPGVGLILEVDMEGNRVELVKKKVKH